MKIKIRLYATLRRFVPDGEENIFTVEMGAGSTVKAAMKCLGIPSDVDAVILVNGRYANDDTILSTGDILTLYPKMVGG